MDDPNGEKVFQKQKGKKNISAKKETGTVVKRGNADRESFGEWNRLRGLHFELVRITERKWIISGASGAP